MEICFGAYFGKDALMKYLMTLLCLLSLALTTHESFAAGAHGVFRVVKGKVSVKSARTGQKSRARLGSKVLPGDVIETEKDSRAKIVMVDNNEINISPESQIKIEKYEFDPSQGKKDVLLNVIYGKVRSKVEQKYDGRTSKFQVKTKSAVAGVRGTDFITGFTPATDTSQVVTFEGRVDFGLPGPNGEILNPVQVVPGQMSEIVSGGIKPPKAIPRLNLEKMDTESNAETAESPSADGGTQAPPPPVADKKGPSEREPSSTREPTMVENSDLPQAPESDNRLAPPPPVLDPIMVEVPNQAIPELIQDGNSNLRIIVNQ